MKQLPLLILSAIIICGPSSGQENNYRDSLTSLRNNYVNEHEVIKGEDKKLLRFYPIDGSYCIKARFEKAKEEPWFKIETTGREKKLYRVYGTLYFSVHDTSLMLQVYQSQGLLAVPKYADYLLIAFTDKTSGEDTYENGRYIDASIAEMESGAYRLDFNKAYNPYCAYINNVYNCPLPPKENDLKVAILSGEMKFGKTQ
ncbi:MAG: DUF1684 domain-containing protein [Bacteroidota bacterium]